VGAVNAAFREWVQGQSGLAAVTHFRDPVPHAELLKLYGETDVQLLILAHTALAPGNLPGKFFEYLASGNFILGIGPVDGDAADVLRSTQAGVMIDRSDSEGIKRNLLVQLTKWKEGATEPRPGALSFSRKNLTRQLSQLLQNT
jgi:hypothetical protein